MSLPMFCSSYVWNVVDSERQSHQMRKGKLSRECVDMFVHHINVPDVWYPQESISFCSAMKNEVTGRTATLLITLGTQYQSYDSTVLPFRAKVTRWGSGRFTYLVMGFTGTRVMWECNYRKYKEYFVTV